MRLAAVAAGGSNCTLTPNTHISATQVFLTSRKRKTKPLHPRPIYLYILFLPFILLIRGHHSLWLPSREEHHLQRYVRPRPSLFTWVNKLSLSLLFIVLLCFDVLQILFFQYAKYKGGVDNEGSLMTRSSATQIMNKIDENYIISWRMIPILRAE